MKVKPNTPFLQFLAPIVLFGFILKCLYHIVVDSELILILPALFFAALILYHLNWINGYFKIVELNSELTIYGLLWGKRTINLNDIKGYGTREVRRRGIIFKEDDLILYGFDMSEILRLTYFEYKEGELERLTTNLNQLGIEFIGHVDLRTQATNLLGRIKRKLGITE